jgi:hypothetical protein
MRGGCGASCPTPWVRCQSSAGGATARRGPDRALRSALAVRVIAKTTQARRAMIHGGAVTLVPGDHRVVAGRGRPPQAAARRAGLRRAEEVVRAAAAD